MSELGHEYSGTIIMNQTGKTAVLVLVLAALSVCGHPVSPAEKSDGKSVTDSDRYELAESRKQQEIISVPTLAAGDLYALVVGISKYSRPSIPELTSSARDARDFAELLKSQNELFRETKVTLLVDETATKSEVEKFLFYELRKAGKDDTIILFMSGHGAVDPKRPGEFFFLTHDADPDYLEVSSVNMTGLRFLRKLDCPRVILIADACHAGGFSKWQTKLAIVPALKFLEDVGSSAGRVVISSSRPDEYSLESPDLDNSVFTHYLIEALLGGADEDRNGVVSVHEAYRYVYQRTKTETEGAQHPQFEGTVEGLFPLAVCSSVLSRPLTSLKLHADPPLADVIVGGRLAGKTNPDGSMYLKFLPMDRPLMVKLRKDGWLDRELGPFTFSKDNMQISAGRVKMKPALASLVLETQPARANVFLNGRRIGKTGSDGRLTVHGIQVGVDHVLLLKASGFAPDSRILTIPVSYVKKPYRMDKISLVREKTSRSAKPETRASSRKESSEGTSSDVWSDQSTSAGFSTETDTGTATEVFTDDPATKYLRFDHN